MRLVLDTNVVASGLLWNGPPAALIELAKTGDIELFTSPPLLAELSNILPRPKFAKAIAATGLPCEELVLGYIELARLVQPTTISPVIKADPSDDQVLACALAAQTDLIVSGDKHLHSLGGQYSGIRIVTAAEAVRLISETQ